MGILFLPGSSLFQLCNAVKLPAPGHTYVHIFAILWKLALCFELFVAASLRYYLGVVQHFVQSIKIMTFLYFSEYHNYLKVRAKSPTLRNFVQFGMRTSAVSLDHHPTPYLMRFWPMISGDFNRYDLSMSTVSYVNITSPRSELSEARLTDVWQGLGAISFC